MKKYAIIFWITTLIIFLFEGVMSALTFNTPMAQEGIMSLGYPLYFGTMLMVFKVLGSLVLVIPQVPKNVKEWAYAGFGIDFVCAFVSLWVVGGLTAITFFPLIFVGILTLSYISWKKISA
ncbi:MAG: hypothetical protein RLY49_141 [Candidatus Parcubacteria bacterium]|jgi:hypothetical protein